MADEARQRRALETYLVAAARTGDRGALGRLAELRGPRLLAHATRLLGHPEEARDAVQEAWIDILRGLPGLREPAAFPAWATMIVTRRCARLVRGKQADRSLARDFAVETVEHVPETGPDAADARTLRAAIAALPPAHRATVALFYLEDMTVPEVALATDVPVGTVKTRLMHARDKLRHLLEGGHHVRD